MSDHICVFGDIVFCVFGIMGEPRSALRSSVCFGSSVRSIFPSFSKVTVIIFSPPLT